MAFFTQNKFNYTTGVPDGNDVYPSVSSTWGDDGAGVLGNGTIAFPTAAGGAGQVLTDVAGNGTLTFADAPSTPPSGSDTQVQYNNGGSFGGMAALTYNDSTGKIIANANASSTGDFEVLAETSGTAAFIDVSKGDLGLGTNVTNPGTFNGRWITMLDADRNGIEMRRTGSDSDGSTIGQILATAPFVSGNSGIIGAISIATDGGTSTNRGGRVVLNVKEDATSNNHQLRLTQSGLVEIDRGLTLNVDGNSSADVKIKGTSGSTIAFFDISKKGIGINTDIVNPSTFNGKWITMLDADRSGIEMKRNGSDTDLSTIGQFFGTSTQISGGSGIAGSFFIGTDGATAGNRGGRVGFSAKENGSNTFHSLIVRSTGIVEVDRGMTLNKDANGAADFEVLAETTGTAFKVDVSSSLVTAYKDMIVGESTSTVGRNLTIQGGDDATCSIILHSNADDSGSARHSYIAYREDSPGVDIWTVGKFSTQSNDFIWYKGGVGSNERMRLETDGDLTITGTTFNVDGDAGTASVINVKADTQSALVHIQGNTSGNASVKDAYFSMSTGGVFRNQVGVDASDSNSFKIANSDGFNSGAMVRFDNSTMAVAFNASASATGDFEVLAETTGTALLVDVANKRLGVGHSLPTGVIHTLSTEVVKFDRNTPNTNVSISTVQMQAISSGNMADGFGPSMFWSIQDNAGTERFIGEMGFIRNGADTEGKFFVKGGTNGTDSFMEIDKDANVTLYGTINPLNATGTVASVFERTTSDTNNLREVLNVTHTTSATQVDGFGAAVRFLGEDTGGVANILGKIGFVMDGAKDFGALIIRGGQDGDTELIRADEVSGSTEIFLNLPTSAGTTGSLYNDSGTVKVA